MIKNIKSFFNKHSKKVTKSAKKAADVNKDGKVDLKDAKAAKNKAAKAVKKAAPKAKKKTSAKK